MASSAAAQFKDSEPGGRAQIAGKSQVSRWRIGLIIKSSGGACKGIFGYAPVPAEWPERKCKSSRKTSRRAQRIQYETVDGGVKLMTVNIGQLPANSEAKALVTFEVRRTGNSAPRKDGRLRAPRSQKSGERQALPFAQSEDRKPRCKDPRAGQKDQAATRKPSGSTSEAIYDWVRAHVDYKSKSGTAVAAADRRSGSAIEALDVLRDGHGDCEGFTSLFVAICRAADIRPYRVGLRSRLSRVLPLRRQRAGTLVSLPVDRFQRFSPRVRWNYPVGHDRPKGRQRSSPQEQGTPAVDVGKADRDTDGEGAQPQCRFVREPAPKD